jgi:cytidine deaminase
MEPYFEKLKTLQLNAYAPYSNFPVASILVMNNGDEFQGVNVENASFGGTICAERAAFLNAISQHGHKASYNRLHLLAGHSDSFQMPCGLCRQVISEFTASNFEIVVYNSTGESKTFTIDELLPHGFSGEELDRY